MIAQFFAQIILMRQSYGNFDVIQHKRSEEWPIHTQLAIKRWRTLCKHVYSPGLRNISGGKKKKLRKCQCDQRTDFWMDLFSSNSRQDSQIERLCLEQPLAAGENWARVLMNLERLDEGFFVLIVWFKAALARWWELGQSFNELWVVWWRLLMLYVNVGS